MHRTLQMIRELGAKAGIALNPHTPVVAIEEVLESADIVLVMTVNPGSGAAAHRADARQDAAASRHGVAPGPIA